MDIFCYLSDDDVAHLSSNCRYQLYGPPERLLAQGQENESLFIIYQGSVDVYITAETGQFIKVASINAGQYFGEMSLLTGDSVSATIIVNTEAIIIEIDHSNMAVLFERRPELIEKISEIVILRKQHNEDINASLLKEKNKEQVKLISRLANRIRDYYKRVVQTK